MSENYTEIVVLCEGKQDEVFIRRFLDGNRVNPRRIRIRQYPGGQGSGKQFVQEEYSKEVIAHRRRATRLNVALIVMHDSDNETEAECRTRLEGSARRAQTERIALLFPRRNVETWIQYLMNGQLVDEETRYPKLRRESECHAAVDRLAAKDEYRLSDDVPASLRAACQEIRRVFPEKRCVELPG